MDKPTLLPCPFCGAHATFATYAADVWGVKKCDATCTECDIQTPATHTQDEAAALWNRRDTTLLDAVREWFEARKAYYNACHRYRVGWDGADADVDAATKRYEAAEARLRALVAPAEEAAHG